MTKLNLKLKNNSEKEFLTTQSGKTITREFQVFDDEDKEIEHMLFNRDDLDVIEYNENIQDNFDSEQEIFKE